MNASGIKLERSTLAHGRVKAPPISVANHRLEFEVLDATGRKLQSGSIDHPLWKEAEGDHPQDKARRQRLAHSRPHGVFHLRLPATSAGARVAFFAITADEGKPPSRRALGEVPLPTESRAQAP